MTFGPDHYVPILKVKRAEKAALGQLSPVLRARIVPFLEIVERKTGKNIDGHLETAFRKLTDSVKGYPRCFLDVRELEPDGVAAASAVFARAAAAGIAFTPVTGVSRTVDVEAALGHKDRGLGIRLTRPEFERGDLNTKVEAFLKEHDVAAHEIDLIVDLGAVDDMIPAGVESLTNAFLADLPDHESWRTFTVSACAFPLSMGGVERHSHQFVERADWIAWRNNLHGRRGQLARLPSFGDCAIQHLRGVEGFDPRTMQVSASIRYTREKDWLLLKGESTRSKLSSLQFQELATKLVYGHLKHCFSGPDHCAGCEAMKAAADGTPGYGTAEAWRRIGTIHHISRVMQELGSLPWT